MSSNSSLIRQLLLNLGDFLTKHLVTLLKSSPNDNKSGRVAPLAAAVKLEWGCKIKRKILKLQKLRLRLAERDKEMEEERVCV